MIGVLRSEIDKVGNAITHPTAENIGKATLPLAGTGAGFLAGRYGVSKALSLLSPLRGSATALNGSAAALTGAAEKLALSGGVGGLAAKGGAAATAAEVVGMSTLATTIAAGALATGGVALGAAVIVGLGKYQENHPDEFHAKVAAAYGAPTPKGHY